MNGTRQARAMAPSASAGCRSRCLGWVGALVLFTLLAAAGLPQGAMAASAPADVSLRVERSSGAVAVAVLAEVHPGESGGGPVLCARPRVVARTRSVCERGLPPPRAPTS